MSDLGALSGDSVSKATGLDDSAEASGVSETPTAAIATLFSGGKATNISTLGASVSLANAINVSGEITGWNSFNSATFDPQAFVYSNGTMKSIDSPSVFPSGTEAYGINNSGTGSSQAAAFTPFFTAAEK